MYPAKMRLLGIDPGLANVGWATVLVEWSDIGFPVFSLERWGSIQTKPKEEQHKRLSQIKHKVMNEALGPMLFEQNPPFLAGIEIPYLQNKNQQLPMVEAIGVIRLSIYESYGSILLVDVTPQQVKKHITGNGRATKVEVAEFLWGHVKVSQELRRKVIKNPAYKTNGPGYVLLRLLSGHVTDAIAIAVTANILMEANNVSRRST